jgi:hypothetical protein
MPGEFHKNSSFLLRQSGKNNKPGSDKKFRGFKEHFHGLTLQADFSKV